MMKMTGLILNEVDIFYIIIVITLTELIMRITPKTLDRGRFGMPISLLLGITLLLGTGLYLQENLVTCLLKGIILGGLASGIGYDGIKTILAHVYKKNGGI